MGESVRSKVGVAGRPAVFIRKQQGTSTTADNYGAGTGATHYDALNGPQDPAIDGGVTTNFQTGTDYFICDGAHVRWGNMDGPGSNPGGTPGVADQGMLPVEDATGAAIDKINIFDDWDMMPGMFFGTYTLAERHSNVPWELYDAANSIYVNGGFQNRGFAGQGVGTTGTYPEGDVEDVTQDATTLLRRHCLRGKAALSDLNGATGRARYHVQGNGVEAAFAAAHVWDGSSFTDVTTAAGDATANDFEILAASAPDGAYIAFVDTNPFSGLFTNLSQVQVGGTGVWEYSKGSDTWGTFTNIHDPTSGFTAGLFDEWVQFNPKSDWTTDTINGSTGYVVRWRKTGGTVTTAARGDQIERIAAACFIHRWNDGAPTRGLCSWNVGGFGLHFRLNGKGNVEFVRHRAIGMGQHSDWATATDIILSGCQFAVTGAMSFNTGTPTWTFRAAQYGTRYWSLADHLHTDKSDPFIQDIIAEIDRGIADGVTLGTDGVTPDSAAFDDLADWTDFLLVGTGPYGSGSVVWAFTFDGCKVRWPGGVLDGLNDTGIINVDTTDNHGFAHYSQHDGTNSVYKRMAVEFGKNCIDFYASATGSNDAPVSGSSNAMKNIKFSHGYCSGIGNQDDTHLPMGIAFENDPDIGLYDDGTGGNTGNQVYFWGFKDIKNAIHEGSCIGIVSEIPPKIRYCVMDNPGDRGAWHSVGGFSNNGPRSTNAITFDGAATFNDVTAKLMDTGNTATDLFPTGAAGEILYLGTVYRVERRFIFNITTAGVGAPVLAWEYHNGSTWTAVSNLVDGTSGLTATGTVTFDRPPDIVTQNINGKTLYAIRCRIVSGSFSTIPRADEIGTYTAAASIDAAECTIKNIDRANGCFVTMLRHGVSTAFTNSGYVLDRDNRIILGAGQSAADNFFAINGVNSYNLAAWQAFEKLALTTDAEIDSIFGAGYTLA